METVTIICPSGEQLIFDDVLNIDKDGETLRLYYKDGKAVFNLKNIIGFFVKYS